MDETTRPVRAAGKTGVVAGGLTAAGGIAVQIAARPPAAVTPEM
jgi:hypothetical protein